MTRCCFAINGNMWTRANTTAKYRYPFHVDYQDMTTVRFAATTAMLSSSDESGAARYSFHRDHDMTTIALAHCDGVQGDNSLQGLRGVERIPETSAPSILVSFFYLDKFIACRDRYCIRDWVMDSGAFSAWNSGVSIDLGKYIETCQKLLAEDPLLKEVFALDVIGDWRAGMKNLEAMWDAGVPAIPTFHPKDEPWELLRDLAAQYPKLALGGLVGLNKKLKRKLVEQCFARAWPKKIHGLGIASEDLIMSFPFHSVDATNWEMMPCAFGNWKSFGAMSVRGSKQNLRAEIEWYLALERRARARWEREMKQLDELAPDLTIRLVVGGNLSSKHYVEKSLVAPDSAGPDVRLALSGDSIGSSAANRMYGRK